MSKSTDDTVCGETNALLTTAPAIAQVQAGIQEQVNTTINNIVDDKNLTPQQKLQQDFGNKLGVETAFFNNENGDFHGAHANGTSYINVNSKMPIGKVFRHESSHWLKSNNSKLYDELAKAAWNDKNFNSKVSFKTSKKFRDKAQELFGYDVEEVFITESDIRRIKKKHGAN